MLLEEALLAIPAEEVEDNPAVADPLSIRLAPAAEKSENPDISIPVVAPL